MYIGIAPKQDGYCISVYMPINFYVENASVHKHLELLIWLPQPIVAELIYKNSFKVTNLKQLKIRITFFLQPA